MVNRLEGDSALSRLRRVRDGTKPDRVPSADGPPDWENDLREVSRRLARLRSEFPGVARQVELNVALVKAGERLNGKARDGSGDAEPESRSQ